MLPGISVRMIIARKCRHMIYHSSDNVVSWLRTTNLVLSLWVTLVQVEIYRKLAWFEIELRS